MKNTIKNLTFAGAALALGVGVFYAEASVALQLQLTGQTSNRIDYSLVADTENAPVVAPDAEVVGTIGTSQVLSTRYDIDNVFTEGLTVTDISNADFEAVIGTNTVSIRHVTPNTVSAIPLTTSAVSFSFNYANPVTLGLGEGYSTVLGADDNSVSLSSVELVSVPVGIATTPEPLGIMGLLLSAGVGLGLKKKKNA